MIIIGIAGGTGSGKTTVVREIVASLPEGEVAVLPLDSYYKDILIDMESEAKSSYPRNFKFKHINNDNEIGLYINGVLKKANIILIRLKKNSMMTFITSLMII